MGELLRNKEGCGALQNKGYGKRVRVKWKNHLLILLILLLLLFLLSAPAYRWLVIDGRCVQGRRRQKHRTPPLVRTRPIKLIFWKRRPWRWCGRAHIDSTDLTIYCRRCLSKRQREKPVKRSRKGFQGFEKKNRERDGAREREAGEPHTERDFPEREEEKRKRKTRGRKGPGAEMTRPAGARPRPRVIRVRGRKSDGKQRHQQLHYQQHQRHQKEKKRPPEKVKKITKKMTIKRGISTL